jgi:dipeptidyl-peptidase-4
MRQSRHVRAAVRVAVLASLALCWGCVGLQRTLKPLTADVVFGPAAVDFSGTHVSGLEWLPDGAHYLERRADVLQRVTALTGDATPAYDYAALETALRTQADCAEADARQLARYPTLHSADYAVAVLELHDRLYLYGQTDGTVRRLTDEATPRRELTLSPDLTHVAFVKDNNLYAIATSDGQISQLTREGSETRLNGVLDWVYEEELYGRGKKRAYWWSEDGRYLAYLQLDDTEVPTYPVVNYLPTHPTVTSMRYPKAGDPNPRVRLGIVAPEGGPTRWVDLSAYEGTEILISGVSWAPDGRLVYAVQDREQRWLDLSDADPETGEPRTLLHETSPAWVEYGHPPKWLADGTFLWLSSRDGWQHLFHYRRDGELICAVTTGRWEVGTLHGVDVETGWVYFSAARDDPLESQAYRIPLAGGEMERLTAPGFSHDVRFDPQFQYSIDTFSNIMTPTKVYLRSVGGDLVRVLSENEVPALREYRLSRPELLRIPTAAGYELNALLIRPPNFQRGKKYPVYTLVYGGPHMPIVRNRWPGHSFAFEQWLAAQGYLVFSCDPHAASAESAASAWQVYEQLGVTELADLETAVRWLAVHENADLGRVAIFGHSYGGYLAAYALTHGSVFTAGIAVAGLADWRNYDSIYTERYMRTPQHNPSGYERSAVSAAARNLHGRLLILHGIQDDNVHVQNALQLMYALQQAEQRFEVMLYPDDDHGVETYYAQQQRLGLEFLKRIW